MKNTIFTILKTLVGSIVFVGLLYLAIVCFVAVNNIHLWNSCWEEAFDILIEAFMDNRESIYLILAGIILALLLSLIIGFIKNKFKQKEFDYNSEYQKFKPKSWVKMTFMDGKEEVTKKVRIISIDSESVFFEDKKTAYECASTDVRMIKKRNKKLLALIIVSVIFTLLALVDLVISFLIFGGIGVMEKYGVASLYAVVELENQDE